MAAASGNSIQQASVLAGVFQSQLKALNETGQQLTRLIGGEGTTAMSAPRARAQRTNARANGAGTPGGTPEQHAAAGRKGGAPRGRRPKANANEGTTAES